MAAVSVKGLLGKPQILRNMIVLAVDATSHITPYERGRDIFPKSYPQKGKLKKDGTAKQ